MKISCDGHRVTCEGGFELHLNQFSRGAEPSIVPLAHKSEVECGGHTTDIGIEALISRENLLIHLGVPPLRKAGPSGFIGTLISVNGNNIISGERDSDKCLLVKGGQNATVILPTSRINELASRSDGLSQTELAVKFIRMREDLRDPSAEKLDSRYATTDFGVGIVGVNGPGLQPLLTLPPYEIYLHFPPERSEEFISEVARRVIRELRNS